MMRKAIDLRTHCTIYNYNPRKLLLLLLQLNYTNASALTDGFKLNKTLTAMSGRWSRSYSFHTNNRISKQHMHIRHYTQFAATAHGRCPRRSIIRLYFITTALAGQNISISVRRTLVELILVEWNINIVSALYLCSRWRCTKQAESREINSQTTQSSSLMHLYQI